MSDEEKEVETMTDVEIKDPKAVLDALERAKSDAKKFREEMEALSARLAEVEKSRESLEATVKTYEDGDNVWKNRVKEQTVKSALGTNAERATSRD